MLRVILRFLLRVSLLDSSLNSSSIFFKLTKLGIFINLLEAISPYKLVYIFEVVNGCSFDIEFKRMLVFCAGYCAGFCAGYCAGYCAGFCAGYCAGYCCCPPGRIETAIATFSSKCYAFC